VTNYLNGLGSRLVHHAPAMCRLVIPWFGVQGETESLESDLAASEARRTWRIAQPSEAMVGS